MPKRLAQSGKATKPSASKFKVNTKRKFGSQTFQVKTRKAINSTARTKYWALFKPPSVLKRKPVLAKRKPRKTRHVLKGGGQNEVVKALDRLAMKGDYAQVSLTLQNNLYLQELTTMATDLVTQIRQLSFDEYNSLVKDFLKRKLNENNPQDSARHQAFLTIAAVYSYYSKNVERHKQLSLQCTGHYAYVPYNEKDNVYNAIRAVTGWPIKVLVPKDAKYMNFKQFQKSCPDLDRHFQVGVWQPTKR